MDQPNVRRAFAALLRWYDKNGRDLPWRKTQDAYPILVSEVMLQQTQVLRVLLYYESWLRLFPDWRTLSSASTASVLRAWAGLGYNRRALSLRDIARIVIKQGEPKSEAEWDALKGIGPYTAAALTAFSLRQPTLPVDTNVRRVLGRLFLGRAFAEAKFDRRLRTISQPALQQSRRASDVPQALFDIATAVCRKVPDCRSCPLLNQCRAAPKFLSGRVRIPKRSQEKGKERLHNGKCYPDRIYRGRILSLVRRSRSGLACSLAGPGIDATYDIGRDEAWLNQIIARLEKDGMLRRRRSRLYLVGE